MVPDTSSLERRARVHAALGEPHRLHIVDALRHSDRTPSELQEATGLSSNLLAFHLDVLDDAELIERRRSQGDGRRRYVTLRWAAFQDVVAPLSVRDDGPVVFVCTRNAARSQMAASLWRHRTGRPALSAGAAPAETVDALAKDVAAARGLDTHDWEPRGYLGVNADPALVVSVCDRARESGLPWTAPHLHWSVPDPAGGGRDDYEQAFEDLEARVVRLARASGALAA